MKGIKTSRSQQLSLPIVAANADEEHHDRCGGRPEILQVTGINLEFYELNYQFTAEINFSSLTCQLHKVVYVQEIKMTVLALLLANKRGVTAIEYSLIAALIAVAAIASFTLIGTDLSTTFSTVAAKM